MTTNGDEFWGTQADWPEVPEGERREPRPGAGATIARWWSNVVGGGTTATREHGILQPVPSGDPRDDDFETSGYGSADADDAVNDSTSAGSSGSDPAVDDWDPDWDVAPSRPPGVDPLLARFGGAAIVLTLLVPLFLGFGGGNDDGGSGNADVAASTVTLPPTPAATPDPTATPAAAPGAPVATATPAPDPSAPTTAGAAAPPDQAAPSVPSTSIDDQKTAQASLTAPDPASAQSVSDVVASESTEPVEPNCAVDYEVVAGDFWIRLADGAGVSLEQLLESNDATTDTALYPGRTICLPDGATTPAPPTTSAPSTTAPPTTAPRQSTNASTTIKPSAAPAAQPVAAPVTKPLITPTTNKPAAMPQPTAAQVEQIIRDVWPDDLEERAIEIARRESNFVPTARNSCCYGVFQMHWKAHRSWLTGLGITSTDQLFDAATNARAAYVLYQRSGGWGPWT